VITLQTIVLDFARGFREADARRPVQTGRAGRQYRPGLGPHTEDAAVALVLGEIRAFGGFEGLAAGQFVHLPTAPRRTADVWIGAPHDWVLEIKMARLRNDNGTLDDTALKDILSPYDADHSALTDCVKLATADFPTRTGVLIYGYDYDDRLVEPLVGAFETLAQERVSLSPRVTAPLDELVHPVHARGHVFAWEVSPGPG
jgi:hypothetical protein